jgi:hypothetical protein
VALLTLAALLGAIWLGFDRYRAGLVWERYRTAALARGEKLSFADFAPPEIPAEENYITGTIFEREVPSAGRRQEHQRPFKLPSKPGAPVPRTATERLETMRAAMVAEGWPTESEATTDAGRAVILGLERYRIELAELRAARPRPSCRLLQSKLPPPHTVFSQTMLAMDVGAVLALQTEAHLAVGDPENALEDFRDGVRLYHAVRGEQAMMGALGRQAVLYRLLQVVDDGLAIRRWRSADCREIVALLAGLDLAADARFAFSSERGFINDAAEAQLKMPLREQVAYVEKTDWLNDEPRGWELWVKLASGEPQRERASQNQVLDHRVQQFALGPERVFHSAPPANAALASQMTTMSQGIAQRYIALEMALRQTRVVCALERFRLARGHYPETLAELPPELLTVPLADVIDGQPMRYRRLGPEEFLLYSIGANERDDAGKADIDKRIKGSFKALDWVWGKPWK